MRSDDKYIDKPDDFSRKVGEKLREHQIPVGPDIWDSLTERLLPRERRISAYWRRVAAGVAAVALVWLLVLLLNPPADEPLLTEHSQPEKPIRPDAVVPEMDADETESGADKKADIKQMVDENSTKSEKIVEPVETSRPEKAVKAEERLNPEETEKLAKAVKPEETSVPEKTSKPEESVEPGTKGLLDEGLLAENDLPLPVQERGGLRSLMAALGSGGLPLDFSFGSYDADNPSYSDAFPGGELNNGDGLGSGNKYNMLNPGDYTDIEHHLPVSFSLTADFPIGKDVSMETGLSYTYLFSRFRRNDDFIYRGTLRQHYIGIPVNVRYVVWQNDAWNIYLLGGGSIEKGLRSIYKQEIEHNGGIVDHSNVYSGIRGFQLSAQGGAGFSYRLQGNLSLFGEPRIVYYFRNNQPMSARTENPLIFGLNMGVRLRFK